MMDSPRECRSKSQGGYRFAVKNNLIFVHLVKLVGRALKWQLAVHGGNPFSKTASRDEPLPLANGDPKLAVDTPVQEALAQGT